MNGNLKSKLLIICLSFAGTISGYSIQPSQSPQQESGVPMWYWDDLMSEYGRPSYRSFGSDSATGGSSSYNPHGGGGGGYSRPSIYHPPPAIDPYLYRPIAFTPIDANSVEQPSFSYYDAESNSVIFWSNEPGQLSIPICLNGDVTYYNNTVSVYVNGQQVYQGLPTLNSNLTFNVGTNSIFNNDQIQWLSDHKSEGMSLVNRMIEDDFTEDGNKVAQYLINAAISGQTNGLLDSFVRGLLQAFYPFVEITQVAIDNVKRDVAIYRLQNPEAKNEIITPYYEVIKDYLHSALDLAGMIPFVGEGFDLTNSVLYELEGDHFNAGVSLAASIPIVGWAATSAKWCFAAAVIAGKGGRSWRNLEWVLRESDGIIQFGDKTIFKELFEANNKVKVSETVFRLIPLEEAEHPLVQAAARASERTLPAFHISAASNGVALERWRFKLGARGDQEPISELYNERIRARLDVLWDQIKNLPEPNRMRAARLAIRETQQTYINYMLRNPRMFIDDVPFLPPY